MGAGCCANIVPPHRASTVRSPKFIISAGRRAPRMRPRVAVVVAAPVPAARARPTPSPTGGQYRTGSTGPTPTAPPDKPPRATGRSLTITPTESRGADRRPQRRGAEAGALVFGPLVQGARSAASCHPPPYLGADRVSGVLHRLPVVFERVFLPERFLIKRTRVARLAGHPDHDVGVLDSLGAFAPPIE